MKNGFHIIERMTGGILLAGLLLTSIGCSDEQKNKEVSFTKAELKNKIKGGWAGQTIGVTYGGPTEFRYLEKIIPDSVDIPWPEHYIKQWFNNTPGLYDDVYMDLTFVNVFERLGLDAPVDSFAMAFATADYHLWHANQGARYNILNGIMPPASGHWKNNPHSNDIDYQIEADFAGLMAPGMPNAASDISDKIGHIMNYGDGWYGGVYVGAMYALAFISDDVEYIVHEALKTIPEQALYHQYITDIIGWYKENPNDWKYAWKKCAEKYKGGEFCPDGIQVPFNIDASINSAYCVIGLLYGQGDFYKTMDIATRCGQDSDCNPATVAGILGVMMGYDKIPERWMTNLKEVEDINFAYTDIPLNKAYNMSFNQALQMIERYGGKIAGDKVTIKIQQPTPVKYEKGFEGLKPVARKSIFKEIRNFKDFTFNGNGLILTGWVECEDKTYVAKVSFFIDGKEMETPNLPASFQSRRHELFWNYDLPAGEHKLTVKWLNPEDKAKVHLNQGIEIVKK